MAANLSMRASLRLFLFALTRSVSVGLSRGPALYNRLRASIISMNFFRVCFLSNCLRPFNDFSLFVFSGNNSVTSVCFRISVRRMSDKTAVNALNSKRMVTFFNEFLITTTSFLNGFASECEDKFFELERKLNKIESNLLIIEDKVSSVEFGVYSLVLIDAF